MTIFTIYSTENQFRKTVVERLGAGEAALATTATTGFLYVPTCAGVPTGVPEPQTGMTALVFDSSGSKLYAYDSGWVAVGP